MKYFKPVLSRELTWQYRMLRFKLVPWPPFAPGPFGFPLLHTSKLRKRQKLAVIAALLYLALLPEGWSASNVRLGILAFSGKADTLQRWQPTARALEQAVPGLSIELVPLNYEELNAAIRGHQLHFVLTNPEHYVVLNSRHGVNALATMNALAGGQPVDRLGSVIFTTVQHEDIRTLPDVRRKRVAAVGLFSLGGYLLAADALQNAGVKLRDGDVASLSFTDVPHSQVVDRVLAGHADVGIVRTGVLESMAAQGRLKLSEIHVLAQRPALAFPQLLSTDLAPEWPFAATLDVEPGLVRDLAQALISLPADSEAARLSLHGGFSAPANYGPVEDLMRRLHTYPDVGFASTLRGVWLSYQAETSLALGGLVLAGLAMSTFLWTSNRRLRRLSDLYYNAQLDLQSTAAAFDSQVGLIVTDQQTRVQRANQAFTTILGHTEPQIKGQTTAMLRALSLEPGRLGQVWQELQQQGRWGGELNCTHLDGHEVPCMVTITATRGENGGADGYVGSFVDMSQHHRDQGEIKRLAYFDVLTGLPNRRMFLEELRSALARVRQQEGHGTLIFVDLDHFKTLNDSHGHSVGDELLCIVSERLRQAAGTEWLVARLGGDEFVVMQEGLAADADLARAQADGVAQTVRETILLPCSLGLSPRVGEARHEISHCCSGSLGVALFDGHDQEVIEIMRRADIAMYQAKHGGRNTIRHYDPEVNRLLAERAALSEDLSRALADQQMVLHYQLQVDRDGQPVAAECLLRWQHPRRGLVSPAQFIPIAEESGAITALGDWVIETACQTLKRWSSVPATAKLELAVNVSPRQFTEADFVEKLENSLARTGAPPQNLLLEITEGILLDNADHVAQRMHRVCALGVSFSVDDFGTGYSSLSYLQRLPLRQLKIDRSFIRDVQINSSSEAIVRAVIGLGASLGLAVVAEGVETEAQREFMVRLGCGLLQGYHLGWPAPLETFEASLSARTT